MRQPSEPSRTTDDSQTHEIERRAPDSFGHRHGLKILGAIMAAMFATVVAVQVAC